MTVNYTDINWNPSPDSQFPKDVVIIFLKPYPTRIAATFAISHF